MSLAAVQLRTRANCVPVARYTRNMKGCGPTGRYRHRYPSSNSKQHRRRPVEPTAATGQDLMDELVEREKQLMMMFQSGKPMPKASEVAQLRSEIAELRKAINSGFSSITPYVAEDEEFSEELQIELLTAENQRLRQRAHALLERQMQLEDLWQLKVVPRLQGHGSRANLKPEEDDVAKLAVQLVGA